MTIDQIEALAGLIKESDIEKGDMKSLINTAKNHPEYKSQVIVVSTSNISFPKPKKNGYFVTIEYYTKHTTGNGGDFCISKDVHDSVRFFIEFDIDQLNAAWEKTENKPVFLAKRKFFELDGEFIKGLIREIPEFLIGLLIGLKQFNSIADNYIEMSNLMIKWGAKGRFCEEEKKLEGKTLRDIIEEENKEL